VKAKRYVPLESTVESYLVEQVQLRGGIAEKVRTIGTRGFFDRLILLPGGKIVFCEVKRPRGGRLSPHQAARIERYVRLGATVAVINNRVGVDELLKDL
jgi:hypothetical protein